MKLMTGNVNRRWSTKDSWSICPHGFKSIPSKRKTCYLEIEVDKWAAGRLEIELYCDIVPVTAQNFLAICESNTEITYAKTTFFRIVPGLFCLGGDVVNNSGTGGCTIDGSSFPDENHILLHNGPGVVSMYKRKPNQNDSQFLITFRKLSSLDEKYVVIGRTKSMRVLGIIEEFGTSSGKPKRRVNVVKCGIV
ncbi:peptidyl-prolyl cis-trans isomerase A-like [Lycorma delicatula]|uniref:peptidyl-prolyl cis-trans isomerase A-like n=1 Tax=Lycorma delicatula TaxID=130591 RepID=UPI003F518D0D